MNFNPFLNNSPQAFLFGTQPLSSLPSLFRVIYILLQVFKVHSLANAEALQLQFFQKCMLQFKFHRKKNLRSRFFAASLLENALRISICRGLKSRSRKKQKVASDAVLTKATVCKGALDPAQSFPYGCEGVQPSFPSHRPIIGCGCPLRMV